MPSHVVLDGIIADHPGRSRDGLHCAIIWRAKPARTTGTCARCLFAVTAPWPRLPLAPQPPGSAPRHADATFPKLCTAVTAGAAITTAATPGAARQAIGYGPQFIEHNGDVSC